jgi:hypothetical protein
MKTTQLKRQTFKKHILDEYYTDLIEYCSRVIRIFGTEKEIDAMLVDEYCENTFGLNYR